MANELTCRLMVRVYERLREVSRVGPGCYNRIIVVKLSLRSFAGHKVTLPVPKPHSAKVVSMALTTRIYDWFLRDVEDWILWVVEQR